MNENTLVKNDDELPATSSSVVKTKHEADELLGKKRKQIADKLRHYESECERYGIQKVGLVKKCLREEEKLCDLNYYAIGSLQCQIMFDSFSINPSTPLTSISLKNNHFDHTCMHSMVQFIATNGTLAELILENCKFGDAGAKILAEGISISTSIVRLNLSSCNINDVGGFELVNAFMTNATCAELNLSHNSLGLQSAQALEEVLKENQSLKSLDLSHNSLFEENAIIPVLKGVLANRSLNHLDLSWNSLSGEIFGQLLMKCLKMTNLVTLNLKHNLLKSLEMGKLAAGLKKSSTLRDVFVEGNQVTADDEVELVKVFYSKSSLSLLSFGKWHQLSHQAHDVIFLFHSRFSTLFLNISFQVVAEVMRIKPHVKVIFQGKILPKPVQEVNMLDIFADRAKFLAMAPKKEKQRRDFG